MARAFALGPDRVIWVPPTEDGPGRWKPVGASHRLLLAVLLQRADERLRAWPTIGELARRTSLSPRQVRRTLSELGDAGFIVRELEDAGRVVTHVTLGDAAPIVSGDVSPALLDGLPIGPSERSVLAAYLLHADAIGEAFPGRSTVSRYAGVSIRQVSESVKRLKHIGVLSWVMVERRGAYAYRRVTIHRERLFALASKGAPPLTSLHRSPPPSVLPPPDTAAPPPGHGCTQTLPREPFQIEESTRGEAARLLRRYVDRLQIEPSSPRSALALIHKHLADGVPAAKIEAAIEGVRASEWRMESPDRRGIHAILRSRSVIEGHAMRSSAARWVDDMLPPPPPPVRVEISPEERRQVTGFDVKKAFARPSF